MPPEEIKRLKPVKAWAVRISMSVVLDRQGADDYRKKGWVVVPVRIVPESEYRAMRAGVRLAEEISSQRYDANRAYPKLLVDRYEQSKRKAR